MSEHLASGVHDMPAEQYFASEAVSNSDLKYIAPPYTPAHFRAYKDGLMERKETEAQRIGTLTHRCILEPEKMRDSFVVKPEGFDGRTKAGKEWASEQAGKAILSQGEADMIAAMANSVWSHPKARALISGSDRERSLFYQDGPLWIKARLDCLTKTGNIIADLKTIQLADLDSVESAIFDHGYYRQAAFYLRIAQKLGIDKTQFVFIFVEKTPPHCVAIYALGDTALEMGTEEIKASISLVKHCTEKGAWPGRDTDINEASVPNWALKRMAASL